MEGRGWGMGLLNPLAWVFPLFLTLCVSLQQTIFTGSMGQGTGRSEGQETHAGEMPVYPACVFGL